jgi:hypothetical protein
VLGGTSPYDYVWSNGSDSASAVNLCNGDYYLVITDSVGCQVNDTITIDLVTSIQNIEGNELSVFPNPSTGVLQLSSTGFEGEKVQVFTISGKLVQQLVIQSNLETFDLSSFGKGIYFIRLEGSESKVIRVLIK